MIVLIRHGETEGNASRVLQVPETPLNARGIAQAERLSGRLAQLGVAAIVCSDLLRARMTAAPLERATGLAAELLPELQERNFGALRGTSYGDLGPAIFAPDFVPEGGESMSVFDARVSLAWQRVADAARNTQGNLVVITHGFVCASIARRFLEIPGAPVPARWGNTSVTLCAKEPPHRVDLLNCVDHLEPGGDDRSSPSGL
jgi:probable phosphoglycerate mutase